jgi:hypothetical protein
MVKMPEYSIAINSTGMGKDIPSSPIIDDGLFPMKSLAWEFNRNSFWESNDVNCTEFSAR